MRNNLGYITIILIISISTLSAFSFETSQIKVGSNPWAVSINPTRNIIYVTNSGNDTVSVIDGKTNAVIKNITVGENPTGVAVNQKTNTVYVSKFSSPTVSVINGTTNTVTENIIVGKQPNGIGVDETTNKI